jgi:hypothetical protein
MNFNNGIVSLIIVFLGVIIQSILNLLKNEIESKEIFKIRLFKYTFASVGIVIYWVLFFIYSNRNSIEIIPKESNTVLLYIFISSLVYLNFNATVSTTIAKKLNVSTSNSNKVKFKKCMIAIHIVFFIITSLFIVPFLSSGKNYVKEDTVVRIKNEKYLLSKNTTFTFSFTKKKPYKSVKLSGIRYKFDGSEYELSEGDKIVLFKETVLKKLPTENNDIIYKNGNKYANACIKSNSRTLVETTTKLTVELDKTTPVYINNSQNIFYSFAFCNIFLISLCLILYYIFKY